MHVEDVKANGTDFQLVEGSLEHTFSSIDAGRSAEFKYILIPRLGNRAFYGGAAQVTYASAAGKEPSKLISNIPLIAILSTAQYIELRLVKVVRFGRDSSNRGVHELRLTAWLVRLVAAGAPLQQTICRASPCNCLCVLDVC